MAWSTSDRRSELPRNWSKIRAAVLKRDAYKCQQKDEGRHCLNRATDVDHIVAGGPDSLANLQSLCRWHHSRKSATEGHVANAKKRADISQRFRRIESHPGAL